MDQNRDPDALTQPGPAALVFELADHLQQFVGVVVDPAGAVRWAGALLRDCGLLVRRGSRSGPVPGGSSGRSTLVGVSVMGIRSTGTAVSPTIPFRVLPIYFLIH